MLLMQCKKNPPQWTEDTFKWQTFRFSFNFGRIYSLGLLISSSQWTLNCDKDAWTGVIERLSFGAPFNHYYQLGQFGRLMISTTQWHNTEDNCANLSHIGNDVAINFLKPNRLRSESKRWYTMLPYLSTIRADTNWDWLPARNCLQNHRLP